MRTRPPLAAFLALLVVPAGCSVPSFQGPQIQEAPLGFTLQPETHPQRRIFPDHEVTFHTGWVHTDVSGVSVIYIDEHPTVFGNEDVFAAYEGDRAAARDPDTVFGDIEAIRVDGRDGWGWYERVESSRRGLVQVTYNAVIPYDSVSYAIEFTSGEPSWKRGAPGSLRDVVATFGIGRTTYNLPLIAIVFGSLLLGISVLRGRARDRAARLRSINLVTIKKDEETAPDGTPSAASPSGSTRPGAPPKGPATTPPRVDPPEPTGGSPDS